MTFHGSLLDALARVLKCSVDDLPTGQPHNDALEARMSHVAETYDDETGKAARLLPEVAYHDLYAEPDTDHEETA